MKSQNILTLPQALQWCLRNVTLNSAVHTWHMVTRWSGIHTGACKNRSYIKATVNETIENNPLRILTCLPISKGLVRPV